MVWEQQQQQQESEQEYPTMGRTYGRRDATPCRRVSGREPMRRRVRVFASAVDDRCEGDGSMGQAPERWGADGIGTNEEAIFRIGRAAGNR